MITISLVANFPTKIAALFMEEESRVAKRKEPESEDKENEVLKPNKCPKSINIALDLPKLLPKLEQKDPALKPLFKELGILPIASFRKKGYVALVGSIIGQIITLSAARKIRSNLYRIIGTGSLWFVSCCKCLLRRI
jgi:3-methyladenine DNA glycosylase/8-oxoguanine DNA glycosylase